MKKEEAKNMIEIPLEEQIAIIKSSVSLSEAARKIIGNNSTQSRTIIREICVENHIDEPKYYHRTKKCLECGKEFVAGDKRKKFCCHACSASYNNRLRTKKAHKCLNCGKDIQRNSKYFCSKECEFEYNHKQYIEKWKRGEKNGCSKDGSMDEHLRVYMIEKNNNCCESCGGSFVNPYTNKSVLQVHHIDGDCFNNKEENLQLLCPTCHAMTENFGSRNKNSRRIDRRTKYYRENIIPKTSAQCD